jgi:hypothetical protein
MHETLHICRPWPHVGILTAYLLSASATAWGAEMLQRAPADGLITSVAITRDGSAIAAGTYGEDCSAALDPSGRIVISGARSLTFSIAGDVWKMRRDETAWLHAATTPDCSAIVAATERRVIWVKSR